MGECGEGNGNPLQYSCLDNPVDRGPWWAAVHGVVQGRTRLKQLSMHACIGEGNGSPLQCFCLENPRDTGAWWVALYGAAQSRTWLESMSKQWWGEVAKKHTHTCRVTSWCSETCDGGDRAEMYQKVNYISHRANQCEQIFSRGPCL